MVVGGHSGRFCECLQREESAKKGTLEFSQDQLKCHETASLFGGKTTRL